MRLLVALLLLLAIPARAEEWTTYTDPEAGFEVSYPADWQAKSSLMPEAELKVRESADAGADTCMVSYARVAGFEEVTPEQGLLGHPAEAFLRLARERYQDVVLLEQRQVEVSGQAAEWFRVSYSRPIAPDAGMGRFETRILYAVANGGTYGVRCESSMSSIQVSGVIGSFRILHRGNMTGPTPD